MKTLPVILAVLALALASCSTYYADRSQTEDGRQLDRELWVQFGGKGGFQRTPDGGLLASADNERSFRDGVTGAVAYGGLHQAGRTERAGTAERNQTERAGIRSGERVERERLRQAGGAAGTIANPETPPEAGRTIGRLLGR